MGPGPFIPSLLWPCPAPLHSSGAQELSAACVRDRLGPRESAEAPAIGRKGGKSLSGSPNHFSGIVTT